MEFGLESEKSDAKYCCQVCGDLATCYRCDVEEILNNIYLLSSPLQAVRSQVSLLLLQDILQASCEGRPDLPL